MTPRVRWLCGAAVIAGATFLAYFPCLNGGFILDDDALLTENKIVRAPDGLHRFWWPWKLALEDQPADYWPVANSTFWLEWRLWKLDSTGYHITNVLLHILASLLLWEVLKRLCIPGAWLAALWFAIHPVNVESVAWISQRKDVLAVLFFLLSIWWWLKANEPDALADKEHLQQAATAPAGNIYLGWYALSLLAFVLGMLSKGSVAILPLALLLIVWWQRNHIRWADVWHVAPFFVVSALFTAVNMWFQARGGHDAIREVNAIQRVLGAGAVVWFYLWKALWPMHLVFVYPPWQIDPNDPAWWLPLAAALAGTGFLVWQRNSPRMKWVRPTLFAWAFFCLALLPVMGFTDVGYMRHTLVADHYQHIAIIGVVALAAAFCCPFRWQQPFSRLAAYIVAVFVSVTLFLLTFRQTGLYVNAMTLYSDTVENNPVSWLAHNNLGLEYYKIGKLNEAIAHYETTLRLNPLCSAAYRNLGDALTDLDRFSEAIASYRRALEISPDDPSTHYNLGLALALSGHPDEAEPEYKKTLKAFPDSPEANHSMGLLLAARGQFPEAIGYFERALKGDPNFVEADVNMAAAYAAMGRYADAVQYAQQALELAQSKKDAKLADGIAARLKTYQERLSNPDQKLPASKEGAVKP
ncbi:MAG TPA: tetratricopeptide repeat protein [Pirellulales bacterium]|nr:tetratricopeptide repeat protein [Pirellulales bacterium]